MTASASIVPYPILLVGTALALLQHVSAGFLIQPVEIGGCYDSSSEKFVHCALNISQCQEDIIFKSPEDLRAANEEHCVADTMLIGRCRDTDQCAITAEVCDQPQFFQAVEVFPSGFSTTTDCTAREKVFTSVPTQYGGCHNPTTNEVVCLLYPTDCKEGEIFVSAEAAKGILNGIGCHCHDVQVGVCRPSHSGYNGLECAIAKDSCDMTSIFVPAREAMEHDVINDLIDCRLCVADSMPVPTLAPAQQDDIQSQQPQGQPSQNQPQQGGMAQSASTNDSASTDDKKPNIGVILGAAIGAIVACMVIAFFVTRHVQRQKQIKFNAEREIETGEDLKETDASFETSIS